MKTIFFILLSVFRVAFVGDPQVDSERELGYARASIYSELRDRKDLDLVVVLGDLVNEKPALIRPSEASLDSIGTPWVRVNGNHDGPDPIGDTCFVAGGVRFILMNNVRIVYKRSYEGGFRECQKAWLKEQLAAGNEPVILCTHIPINEMNGLDSLQTILQGREKLLFMCGHLHRVARSRFVWGPEEVIAGAACGSWWRGKKDEFGIPYAVQGCGSPRGYFLSDLRPQKQDWYTLQYKCIQRPVSYQASVSPDDGKLVINVFGGSPEGKLKIKVGGKWYDAVHSRRLAPETGAVLAYTGTIPRKQRKAMKEEYLPMLNRASTHIWVLSEAGEIPSKVRLRYSDGAMHFRIAVRVKPAVYP